MSPSTNTSNNSVKLISTNATKTTKTITNINVKKLSTPSTSGNNNININNNQHNISSSNSRTIIEQVTNYINFLEIEQDTSNVSSKKCDDTQKSKLIKNKNKFCGRKQLQKQQQQQQTNGTASKTNFNIKQRKLEEFEARQQHRKKLLFFNHRLCTCNSNDDDKTAICEAHAKFNKHFSIDFLLKHPPQPPPHM